MNTKMQLTIKLDQRITINQQVRQAISLLQYNTLELLQVVKQHIESNPLLDIEEAESVELIEEVEDYDNPSHYSFNHRYVNYSDENMIENYSKSKTLREHLLEQTLLCHFSEQEQFVAEAIIDAIDDDGFLTVSVEEIHQIVNKQMSVEYHVIQNVLSKIQSLDPAGVGSRDIRECLLIQLNAISKKDDCWESACQIVNELSNDLTLTNMKRIIKQLKETHHDYVMAIELIKSLNFHPGANFISEKNYIHDPELYVKKISGKWKVFVTNSLLNHVKINKQYQELIKKEKKHAAYPSLKQELEEAKWLISGLKKRNETLLNVATFIIKAQQDFLEKGQEFMKPMNIIDVSKALDLHESTVSRITTGKYIATPRGVFELKYFFPSHVKNTETGEACSDIAVKEIIKDIIEHESPSHVLSDSDIVEILKNRGINIARRTVAKYRESMNLFSSYERQMRFKTPLSALSTQSKLHESEYV